MAEALPPRVYDRLWDSGLLNVGAITGRELGAYFTSPIGYVVGAVLVVPVSLLGYLGYLAPTPVPISMQRVFQLVAFLMVFLVPLYTMRLLAEERRADTLEMLLTSPVRDWEVVLGKWLAALVFYLATIAFTVAYVVLISIYTPEVARVGVIGLSFTIPAVDYGSIVAGYLGLLLVGAAWAAIGLFASSLTRNQIIAAVLGIGLLLSFEYLFGVLAGYTAGAGTVGGVFGYLDASSHAGTLWQGRILLRDVVYFLTLTIGALFVTTRVLESRRWRA
jgi:ABC-2 type transport system permease protein